MLLNRILVFSSLAVLAAIVSASALDAVTLKRNAKVGDTSNYSLKVDLEIEGVGELQVTADITDEVIKIEKDGTVTITSSTENQVVMMGGSPVQEASADTSTTTFAASGLIKEIKASQEDEGTYRFASLMNIMWPTNKVDVGSKWEIKTKAEADKGTFDMTYNYEIVGREDLHGHDCFKIEFKTKETTGSASSEGTVWLDVKTGLMVKIDGDMFGAPMMGTVIDAHFVVEMTD